MAEKNLRASIEMIGGEHGPRRRHRMLSPADEEGAGPLLCCRSGGGGEVVLAHGSRLPVGFAQGLRRRGGPGAACHSA